MLGESQVQIMMYISFFSPPRRPVSPSSHPCFNRIKNNKFLSCVSREAWQLIAGGDMNQVLVTGTTSVFDTQVSNYFKKGNLRKIQNIAQLFKITDNHCGTKSYYVVLLQSIIFENSIVYQLTSMNSLQKEPC